MSGRCGGGLAHPCPRLVHPRASGEHAHVDLVLKQHAGSSPRERGTLRHVGFPTPATRFIPARAGNTWKANGKGKTAAVHPRASGEHAARATASSFHSGSSPRERGTPLLSRDIARLVRFIPARAGNTARRARRCVPAAVHPRARGEHVSATAAMILDGGSSPRERGTRGHALLGALLGRFIPARAGNTVLNASGWPSGSVHPRASGEHQSRLSIRCGAVGSSPRERGTRHRWSGSGQAERFIPARAGNTRRHDTRSA